MRSPLWPLWGLLLLLLGAVPAGAERSGPGDGTLSYAVLRNGAEIGSHVFRFRHDGHRLIVEIHTRMAVRWAVLTVYRFEHDGTEIWQGDRLVAMQTRTNDDGKHHLIDARSNDTGTTVEVEGKPHQLEAGLLPASLWNPRVLAQAALLNTVDGTPAHVAARQLGEEMLQVQGRAVVARHYALTGDLAREVWYDPDGRLVKVRFKAKDDSDIEYVLR